MKKKDSVQDFYCIDGRVSLSSRAIAAIVAPRGRDGSGGLRGAELRTLLAFLGRLRHFHLKGGRPDSDLHPVQREGRVESRQG